MGSRNKLSPNISCIASPVSAEHDLQEWEAEGRAQQTAEIVINRDLQTWDLDFVQGVIRSGTLNARTSEDINSDPCWTHSTGSAPRGSTSQDLGRQRKTVTKNKRFRQLPSASQHARRGNDVASEVAPDDPTVSATFGDLPNTAPVSAVTYKTHPVAFVEHILRAGTNEHRMLNMMPHELLTYLLDYFHGDAQMAEIGWMVWRACGNRLTDKKEAIQKCLKYFDSHMEDGEPNDNMVLMHDLVFPSSQVPTSLMNFSKARVLLPDLIAKMQGYGPLYIPNALVSLFEEYKKQSESLESPPIIKHGRVEYEVCVRCKFHGAMCSACRDVLEDVRTGKPVPDNADAETHMWSSMPCECDPYAASGRDGTICERCLNMLVAIRKVEPVQNEAPGFGAMDIITKKDECFPAGYRQNKVAELRRNHPTGRLRGILGVDN